MKGEGAVARLSPLFTWRSAVASSELESTTKLVAYGLSLHMSERGSSCFPSYSRLAAETSLARATVIRHVASLIDGGWLRLAEVGGGRGKANRYEAAVPEKVSQGDRSEKGHSDETVILTHEKGNSDVPKRVSQDDPRALREGDKRSDTLAAVRPRDELWDVFVAEIGLPQTESERGKRNRALRELRAVGATPDELRTAIAAFRRMWPQATLTATGVSGNWSVLTENTKPDRGARVRALMAERNIA